MITPTLGKASKQARKHKSKPKKYAKGKPSLVFFYCKIVGFVQGCGLLVI
jgi:hypothetical protein